MTEDLTRRKFLKRGLASAAGAVGLRGLLGLGLASGAGFAGLEWLRRRPRPLAVRGLRPTTLSAGVFVARGEDPAALVRAAVEAAGGMGRLVGPGTRVVIKPNIAWDRPPEMAATTNPEVVAELVRLCLAAGAGTVRVFDRTVAPNPAPAYERSGIAGAARAAGAAVQHVRLDSFRDVPIPGGKSLASWSFCEEVLTCDVLINVPVLKHHSSSLLTMGLKNVFGVLGGNRGLLHQDMHARIADLNRVVRWDLTVLDAYRVLRRHGPTGGRLEDVDNSAEGARRVIVSRDPVAADAYGASLFNFRPQDVGFIREAQAAGLGDADFRRAGLHEFDVRA